VGDHVSKGNDFIVVNDLADGLSIRFSDLAQTDLTEKLLGIVETPRLPETPQPNRTGTTAKMCLFAFPLPQE